MKDWREGQHKALCKVLQQGNSNFQGLDKNEKTVSKNAASIGTAIFQDNFLRFLAKAVVMGVDIVDCICVVDLLESPPLLRLMSFGDFFDYYVQDEHKIDAFNQVLACYKGGFNTATVSHGATAGDLSIVQVGKHMQEADLAMMQSEMKERMLGEHPEYFADPKIREVALEMIDMAKNQIEAVLLITDLAKRFSSTGHRA